MTWKLGKPVHRRHRYGRTCSRAPPAGSRGFVTATALIVVDMLNHYEHDDADLLIDDVQRILPSLRRLIRKREREGAGPSRSTKTTATGVPADQSWWSVPWPVRRPT
jgi:hypothetical protein